MAKRLLNLARSRRAAITVASALVGLVLASACSSDSGAHDQPGAEAGTGGSGAARPGASGGSNHSAGEGGAESLGGTESGGTGDKSAQAGAPDGGGSETSHPEGGASEGGAAGSAAAILSGTVAGPDGASMTVPEGALTSPVSLEIAEDATGAPDLPAGMLALGKVYAFTPHGTEFAKPVTVQVPFNAAAVPSDVTPVLLQAEPGGAFTPIPAQVEGTLMTAEVSSLSWFVVARNGTQGTLIVTIAGQPQGSYEQVEGLLIRTGPAGSVYVMGRSTDLLDPRYTSTSHSASNFVAKLTTTLGFEWVRQEGLPGRVLSVGPTGNLYYNVWDSTGFIQSLQSVNPSGAVRAEFSVPITTDWIVTAALTDSQDNPTLLGWHTTGATSYTGRAEMGSFTSSGKVSQALAQLSFGSPVGNSYTTLDAAVTNSAGLFLEGIVIDVTSQAALGTYIQLLDSKGSARAGFPIVDSKLGSVSGLVTLPGTSDLIELIRYNEEQPAMLRYHENGSLAAGFPKTLATGSSHQITSLTAPVSDGQGNVYVVATLDLPGTDLNYPDEQQSVLSYTSDGALRAGYPLVVGYKNARDANHPTITDMAVDGTGTMYFTGRSPTPTGDDLLLERFPAR